MDYSIGLIVAAMVERLQDTVEGLTPQRCRDLIPLDDEDQVTEVMEAFVRHPNVGQGLHRNGVSVIYVWKPSRQSNYEP